MLNYILHCRPAEIKTCKSYTVSIHVFSLENNLLEIRKNMIFYVCLLMNCIFTPGEDYIWVVMSCAYMVVYDVLTFTIHRTLSFLYMKCGNKIQSLFLCSWLGFLFLFAHEEKIISFFFCHRHSHTFRFVCLTLGVCIIFGVLCT